MTARGVFERALALLGYDTATADAGHAVLLQRALAFCNQIYADLHYLHTDADFAPLPGLDSEIYLPGRAVYTVMPYGVAMLLAQSESDAGQQQLFAQMYQGRRSLVARHRKVADLLPKTGCSL